MTPNFKFFLAFTVGFVLILWIGAAAFAQPIIEVKGDDVIMTKGAFATLSQRMHWLESQLVETDKEATDAEQAYDDAEACVRHNLKHHRAVLVCFNKFVLPSNDLAHIDTLDNVTEY